MRQQRPLLLTLTTIETSQFWWLPASDIIHRVIVYPHLCLLLVMLSPVESLPVELFDIISAELSIPECQSLRLTSRQLHRLIHANFSRLAFSEQSTTLSVSSLDRLINVSSHRSFRDAVKSLHLRLLNYHEYENLNAISRLASSYHYILPTRVHAHL